MNDNKKNKWYILCEDLRSDHIVITEVEADDVKVYDGKKAIVYSIVDNKPIVKKIETAYFFNVISAINNQLLSDKDIQSFAKYISGDHENKKTDCECERSTKSSMIWYGQIWLLEGNQTYDIYNDIKFRKRSVHNIDGTVETDHFTIQEALKYIPLNYDVKVKGNLVYTHGSGLTMSPYLEKPSFFNENVLPNEKWFHIYPSDSELDGRDTMYYYQTDNLLTLSKKILIADETRLDDGSMFARLIVQVEITF